MLLNGSSRTTNVPPMLAGGSLASTPRGRRRAQFYTAFRRQIVWLLLSSGSALDLVCGEIVDDRRQQTAHRRDVARGDVADRNRVNLLGKRNQLPLQRAP